MDITQKPGINITVGNAQQLFDLASAVLAKTKKPADTLGTRRSPNVRACLALILSRPTVTGPLSTAGELVIA